MELDPVLIGRWQFGITTVYHFWMVPLTLGLGMLVAVLQTIYHRTANEVYLRATKFFGKLFLINFIMGVATGLVQEFQFGMAWSEYSRFVGDVFGAPLALEALLAFFLESTFLGLWIFGWGRLPRAIHLGSLWLAVIGTWLSAYFIIVANSWMQHPVGVEMVDGRPVMTDVWAVLGNNTAIAAFTHTIFGALAVGGSFLLGISWYHLYHRRKDGIDTVGADGKVIVGSSKELPGRDKTDHTVWIKSLRIGAIVGPFITGALVTAQFALAQPNRVTRLLLSDAPLRTDEKTINTQMKALRLIPRFLLRRRGIDKDEAMESLESLRDHDLTGQLGILGIPLTIFSAADTPDTIEGAKVIRVPEGLWYENNPALVVRELHA